MWQMLTRLPVCPELDISKQNLSSTELGVGAELSFVIRNVVAAGRSLMPIKILAAFNQRGEQSFSKNLSNYWYEGSGNGVMV